MDRPSRRGRFGSPLDPASSSAPKETPASRPTGSGGLFFRHHLHQGQHPLSSRLGAPARRNSKPDESRQSHPGPGLTPPHGGSGIVHSENECSLHANDPHSGQNQQQKAAQETPPGHGSAGAQSGRSRQTLSPGPRRAMGEHRVDSRRSRLRFAPPGQCARSVADGPPTSSPAHYPGATSALYRKDPQFV